MINPVNSVRSCAKLQSTTQKNH